MAGVVGSVVLFLACGARTALFETAVLDDASVVGVQPEGGTDAVDALRDVVFYVPPDVTMANGCPDAAATLIYVITADSRLYSFYPPTSAFSFIGMVRCPGSANMAFSMAVDRAGIAYVLYDSGAIFRVDTATAACTPLPYVAGQSGFTVFGMGFAANGTGPGETLYVEGDTYYRARRGETPGLARIDTTTWTLTPIGSTTPPFYGGELTGTGAGDLFSFFFYATDTTGSRVGQLDKTTGQLLRSAYLPSVTIAQQSFAVAFWGGDFYLFTDGTVTRYSPTSGLTSVVVDLGDSIVGAGVSTCAPQ